ncbi:MAG TPA: type IV pilus twitching motility protein PilT [Acidimicrobiia bacterium]|nr:type IV pilus twitching motility protein PilT [Acidimicrobiia bacterium]
MAISAISLAPIDRFLNTLWERGGSDLLLTAYNRPLVRIDGHLLPIEEEPVLDEDHVAHLVLSTLTEELKQDLRINKEVDFSFAWNGVARFRANCFFQQGALAMALRIIPLKLPTFNELGLPPAVEYFSNLPQGLVLVTGPTGSGKSTTLAAMINYINENRAAHLLTIEDPIEYVHPHKRCAVSQREVGYDTLSFERALRAALREDPDVILVGEMRDPETVQFALSIAETGHLVFATLHTNDAPQALDRISDMFPAERQNQIRVQLAACISGVVSQRLVPRIGGGMAAAFEILIANNAVRSLVREGKTHQIRNIISSGHKEGMCTLESWMNHLVANGIVTYEDAFARSMHPREIKPPVGQTAYSG